MITEVNHIMIVVFIIKSIYSCNWESIIPDPNDLNRTYRGVRSFEVIYLRILSFFFPFVRGEKKEELRALFFTEITTILVAHGLPFYKNVDFLLLKELFSRALSQMGSTLESEEKLLERIRKKNSKNYPNDYQNSRNALMNFFSGNFHIFKDSKDSDLFFFTEQGLPKGNLLTPAIWVAKPNYIFCHDMTYRAGTYLIFIRDMASRYVIKYLYSDTPITAKEYAEFLDDFFTKLNKFMNYSSNRKLIFHGDAANFNLALLPRKVLFKHNITISVASNACENPIAEGFNHVLWSTASRFGLKSKEKIIFRKLKKGDKRQFLTLCMNHININKISNEWKLENISPYQLYRSSLFYSRPDQLTAEKYEYLKRKLLFSWHYFSFQRFTNIQLQSQLKVDLNITINYIGSPIDFLDQARRLLSKGPSLHTELMIISNLGVVEYRDRELLTKIIECGTLEKMKKFLDFFIEEQKKNQSLEPKFLLKLDNLAFQIQENQELKILNDIEDAQNETKDSLFKEGIQNETTDHLEKKKSVNLDFMDRMDRVYNFEKEFKKDLAEESSMLVIRKDKDIELTDRKLRESIEAEEIAPTSLDDYKHILGSIKFRNTLAWNIDKMVHTILKYTGLSVFLLRYFTLKNLNDLFNYKGVIIKVGGQRIIRIPLLPESENVIQIARYHWKVLKQLLKEKGFNSTYYSKIRVKESELWGTKNILSSGLIGESLKLKIDSQLKAPAKRLKKNLNSSSYRLEVAFKVSKSLGLGVGYKFLKYSNSSSNVHLGFRITKSELIEIYKSAHKDPIPEENNFDNISDQEILCKLREIISNENN